MSSCSARTTGDSRACSARPASVGATALPPLLLPKVGALGLVDHEKAFCADPAQDIFDLRRIDRTTGALVIVRPDQHVAHVLPLDATDELAAFFAGFLI